jgi:hypothetical protein
LVVYTMGLIHLQFDLCERGVVVHLVTRR